jgi:hypothetical protein
MHQRLELKRLNLHTNILTPHDQQKLQREAEIRTFIVNAATVGIVFEGTAKKKKTAQKKATKKKTTSTPRTIPFALRSADDLAQRVNAFAGDTFRLTKQRAGELVSALFTVHYERKRVQNDGEQPTKCFSGYYSFAHNKHGIICKTLVDFLHDAGVDGLGYAERFQQVMKRVVEEKAVYFTEKAVR